MRFQDIPKFTFSGNYAVHVDWRELKHTLDRYTKTYNLDMNPDFQRGHVWNDDKRTAYVEFILRGGDSSREVYFNCKGWMAGGEGPMQLVDGKQRIEAVMQFLDNKIPAFGHYFNEYTDRMNNAWFHVHVNNLPTRAQVLQWYIDLNAGGVVHTSEEINKVKKLLEEEKEKKP